VGAMALTFLVASLVHLGLRLPLGSATLTEPRIIPAAVVVTDQTRSIREAVQRPS
jgi:hypothetical protein